MYCLEFFLHNNYGGKAMNNNNSDNNGKNGADARSAQLEEIKELGSVSSFDGKHKIYCLTIIGEIEGHNVLPEQTKTTKYEHVIPQLVAVEESMEIEGEEKKIIASLLEYGDWLEDTVIKD